VREKVGWSVVMAKPNCENLAVANLERQGYTCYFPRILQQNGKVNLIRPLFPRYLFVAITERWYSIRGTRGVSYILLGDNGPATIPPAVIESIKSKENEQGFIVLLKDKPAERFSKGDKVKPIDGPMTGIDMIYDGMAPHDRVKVLANILGQQIPILIEEKLLASA
jgi:transcriptional antiterminator RfaH